MSVKCSAFRIVSNHPYPTQIRGVGLSDPKWLLSSINNMAKKPVN